MIVTNDIIKMNLVNYSNKNTKLAREVKKGKYFKIINGLYETDSKLYHCKNVTLLYKYLRRMNNVLEQM